MLTGMPIEERLGLGIERGGRVGNIYHCVNRVELTSILCELDARIHNCEECIMDKARAIKDMRREVRVLQGEVGVPK